VAPSIDRKTPSTSVEKKAAPVARKPVAAPLPPPATITTDDDDEWEEF
jgi:hypothetical protein